MSLVENIFIYKLPEHANLLWIVSSFLNTRYQLNKTPITRDIKQYYLGTLNMILVELNF